jgi:hypothetical protein
MRESRIAIGRATTLLDRSASGDNDLDFLLSRADVPRFTAILGRMGFAATAPAEKQLPVCWITSAMTRRRTS